MFFTRIFKDVKVMAKAIKVHCSGHSAYILVAGTVYEGCSFVGMRLQGDATECTFKDCAFIDSLFESAFSRAKVIDCKFNNCVLSRSLSERGAMLFSACEVKDCNFKQSSFVGCFSNCSFVDTKLDECGMDNATFSECTFSKVRVLNMEVNKSFLDCFLNRLYYGNFADCSTYTDFLVGTPIGRSHEDSFSMVLGDRELKGLPVPTREAHGVSVDLVYNEEVEGLDCLQITNSSLEIWEAEESANKNAS